MIRKSILNIASNGISNSTQKSCSGCYDIRVKTFLIDICLDFSQFLFTKVILFIVIQQLLFFLFDFLALHGSPKTSRSLLIHFGPRCDTIDSKIEQFFRSYDVHNLIDILIDVIALFFEVAGLFDVFSFGIAARMDEAVHVNIEIIDVGVRTIERIWLALDGIA